MSHFFFYLGWEIWVIDFDPSTSKFKSVCKCCQGVTEPMLYIGMLFSMFAWHIEDHYLYRYLVLNFLERYIYYSYGCIFSMEYFFHVQHCMLVLLIMSVTWKCINFCCRENLMYESNHELKLQYIQGMARKVHEIEKELNCCMQLCMLFCWSCMLCEKLKVLNSNTRFFKHM